MLGSTLLAAAAVPLAALAMPAAAAFASAKSLGGGDDYSVGAARRRRPTSGGGGAASWAARLASNLLAATKTAASGGANGASGGFGGGVQSRVDSVMGWIERSVEHLPNFPRLHPQECVKRSICEAHNEPERHGATGFVLRLLFPATTGNQSWQAAAASEADAGQPLEYKVTNKYRHAAGYGLSKRLDNNGTGAPSVCKEKYEDCVVSLLDVAQNLIDAFLR